MLDLLDVVAAAQIVLFVEAHCVHERVSVEFFDRRASSVPSVDRTTSRQPD